MLAPSSRWRGPKQLAEYVLRVHRVERHPVIPAQRLISLVWCLVPRHLDSMTPARADHRTRRAPDRTWVRHVTHHRIKGDVSPDKPTDGLVMRREGWLHRGVARHAELFRLAGVTLRVT